MDSVSPLKDELGPLGSPSTLSTDSTQLPSPSKIWTLSGSSVQLVVTPPVAVFVAVFVAPTVLSTTPPPRFFPPSSSEAADTQRKREREVVRNAEGGRPRCGANQLGKRGAPGAGAIASGAESRVAFAESRVPFTAEAFAGGGSRNWACPPAAARSRPMHTTTLMQFILIASRGPLRQLLCVSVSVSVRQTQRRLSLVVVCDSFAQCHDPLSPTTRPLLY
uniref:Uncharacterized protein n=1 Tax=Chloropicon primus TaxID=1764295 RepID=A0A7S2T2Q4_9CHLO|mmetsp:Transcript_4860/g.14526  ORF Transcript_4860/g.14526 Transcript_4860/m.14526 type:complete len:220 (+) Transcript_4860:588-1247(+)